VKKIILIGGVVIVLAVAGGAYYFLTQLNAIVERQIEKIGSQITGTKVSVSSVDIKLREGSGAILPIRLDIDQTTRFEWIKYYWILIQKVF